MTYLVIDNYDSFVHNLARYFELAGVKTLVKRNDEITLRDIETINPHAIIISPGPCKPADAGLSVAIIKHLGATLPILGVCLGHQAIGEAYGGKTVTSDPVHGMPSNITHDHSGLFHGLSNPLTVGRYHSLMTDMTHAHDLTVTARTKEGIIMAMKHTTLPVYGVQFHPESILTDNGLALIQNFVKITHDFYSA